MSCISALAGSLAMGKKPMCWGDRGDRGDLNDIGQTAKKAAGLVESSLWNGRRNVPWGSREVV